MLNNSPSIGAQITSKFGRKVGILIVHLNPSPIIHPQEACNVSVYVGKLESCTSQGIGEPRKRLQKGLLLGELVLGNAQVCANGESMLDSAEEVYLPGLACLGKDGLGFVTELCGEDAVGF